MRYFFQSLLVFLLLAAALPVSAQFRSEMRTANKEYELNAYNLAIESYKKALARRPNNVEALSRIADSYRMLNQMQTAHSYYQQVVRERKVEAKTLLEHAHVLKALGRYDEAKQWYLLYARDHDQVVGNHFAQSCDFALRQISSEAGFVVQASSVNAPVADFGPSMPSPGQLVFNSARTVSGENFDGQARNRPFVAAVGPGWFVTGSLCITYGLHGRSRKRWPGQLHARRTTGNLYQKQFHLRHPNGSRGRNIHEPHDC
jgi:tetratricopeptide (TPR) repeat protein